MAKRTKKVGIVGKYGTRYGASLRKMVKKIEISQHAKYTCSFCGKVGAGGLRGAGGAGGSPGAPGGGRASDLPGPRGRAAVPTSPGPPGTRPGFSGKRRCCFADQDEKASGGHLALRLLHEDRGRRRLDLQHHFCCHSKVCHQKTEGVERPVEAPPCET
uniref:Ribosomal protein L37a n=3 Tax=Canis lupus TaxID=9612 RepID=A0A8I3PT04_CANLF